MSNILQLEVGSSSFVLRLPFNRHAILTTACWVTSVWEFCSKHSLLPYLPTFSLPMPTCSNDKAIMDVALNCTPFSKSQLHQINLVRLYLRIFFLSDLVRPLSSRVTDCYMLGYKDAWSDSKCRWPRINISHGARLF